MEKGKTKGAAIHRALAKWPVGVVRKRCGHIIVQAYYAQEVVRAARRWDVFALHAGLHAWNGSDVRQLASDMGTLLWIGLQAATLQGMSLSGRDAQYIANAGDALAMVRDRPGRLQLLRGRLQTGLEFLQALRLRIGGVYLAEAERRLRKQLRIKGWVGTDDLRVLARRAACATPAAA